MIFPLEFFRYCDHMDTSILQTSFLLSFYSRVEKIANHGTNGPRKFSNFQKEYEKTGKGIKTNKRKYGKAIYLAVYP